MRCVLPPGKSAPAVLTSPRMELVLFDVLASTVWTEAEAVPYFQGQVVVQDFYHLDPLCPCVHGGGQIDVLEVLGSCVFECPYALTILEELDKSMAEFSLDISAGRTDRVWRAKHSVPG